MNGGRRLVAFLHTYDDDELDGNLVFSIDNQGSSVEIIHEMDFYNELKNACVASDEADDRLIFTEHPDAPNGGLTIYSYNSDMELVCSQWAERSRSFLALAGNNRFVFCCYSDWPADGYYSIRVRRVDRASL